MACWSRGDTLFSFCLRLHHVLGGVFGLGQRGQYQSVKPRAGLQGQQCIIFLLLPRPRNLSHLFRLRWRPCCPSGRPSSSCSPCLWALFGLHGGCRHRPPATSRGMHTGRLRGQLECLLRQCTHSRYQNRNGEIHSCHWRHRLDQC